MLGLEVTLKNCIGLRIDSLSIRCCPNNAFVICRATSKPGEMFSTQLKCEGCGNILTVTGKADITNA